MARWWCDRGTTIVIRTSAGLPPRCSVLFGGNVGAEDGEEGGDVDGFGGEVGASGGEAAVAVVGHGAGGEGDDGGGDAVFAEEARGVVAVEFRHLHVHEDEVERGAGVFCGEDFVDGGAAVVGDGDGGSGAAEDVGDEDLVVAAIFREENGSADGFRGGGGGEGRDGRAVKLRGRRLRGGGWRR